MWQPSAAERERAVLTRYLRWLDTERGRSFAGYRELWAWSVGELESFWTSVWDFFGVTARRPADAVLADRRMPGARWFAGAELNYVDHVLRRRDDGPAVLWSTESGRTGTLSFAELARLVGSAAAGLRRLGVRRGDRVAALLPNAPEALIGFLAAASLGAIWSSCAPEFGVGSVLDRFRQIEPAVLLAVEGYRYGGRWYDRREVLQRLAGRLPSLRALVLVPSEEPSSTPPDVPVQVVAWAELLTAEAPPEPVPVPFEHPLWILYSSGTTGLPKPIVHGHGGILLEHLKALGLHGDLGPGDRFFWFTTTGWMMWNYLVGGLLVGATVVLYDGSPAAPDLGSLWRLAERERITCFGTSAPYLLACEKAGVRPARAADLTSVRILGSTGAPLPPEGFRWVYREVKADLLLASVSGGTDLCTAFVGSCPLLPVRAGELQCRELGARVEAYDEAGRPVVGQTGELVITAPMPSMPLYLWGDADGSRYRASYFERYPGVWRHGDWIEITPAGGCLITGRSDATLNRGGVRIGTAELYRVVEALPEVADALVVHLEPTAGGADADRGRPAEPGVDRLILYVVLRPGAILDERLRDRIAARIREDISPRHVPDEVHAIAEVPRTLNGKKLEVPVKRVLSGTPVEEAASLDAVANPAALEALLRFRPAPRGASVGPAAAPLDRLRGGGR